MFMARIRHEENALLELSLLLLHLTGNVIENVAHFELDFARAPLMFALDVLSLRYIVVLVVQ